MGKRNIDAAGKKNVNWSASEKLDEGFVGLDPLFKHLDKSYGGTNGFIDERVLDNLYQSVTGNASQVDFSTTYGGSDKKVNNVKELKSVLEYLESLDSADVFKLVKPRSALPNGISPTPLTVTSPTPLTVTSPVPLTVTSPIPQEVIDEYKLNTSSFTSVNGIDYPNGFYNKVIYANGIPIFSSSYTSDQQLLEAVTIINDMTKNKPEIIQKMKDKNEKIILLAYPQEKINTPPDIRKRFSDYTDDQLNIFTYLRQDELEGQSGGATLANLWSLRHEFAHQVGLTILPELDSNYQKDLSALYEAEKSKFQGYYAETNSAEFWAEIVKIYFGEEALISQPPRPKIQGQEDLKNLSPASYEFVKTYFG